MNDHVSQERFDRGEPALELLDVVRTYRQGPEALHVLKGASVTLHRGEIVAMVGPSGAGKSTLLHVAGLLERPDGGVVRVDGRDCARMSDGERTALRRASIGFVYQFHHLLPEFSALENVMLPMMIAATPKPKAKARAQELLDLVGLADRASHRPARLSGGEQQRVAIVRALANEPRVMIGDEPTGNLDVETAAGVMEALVTIVRQVGLACLIATHNLELAGSMDRCVRLEAGRLVERVV